MADIIFDKNRPAFMEIYNNITSKPYSYVIVDSKADTSSRRQVIAEVFGDSMSYNITGAESAMSVTKQATKAIDLKEDSVTYYKTDHSKTSSFTWTNVSGLLFKMSFEKQSVVVKFQLAGYCGVYIL